MEFNINGTQSAAALSVNATLSEQGFGAWVSSSISEAANKVNDVASASWTAVTTAVTDTATNAQEFISAQTNSATGAFTSTINDFAGNGTFIGDTYASASQTVSENSLYIRYAGAALGGMAAINSAMNLLQARQNNQPTREFAKIVVGTGLVALSLYASNEDELPGLGNVALGAGLATALLKVATHVKETFHIHMYKLKSRDASPELQNVVQISTNS